MKKKNEDSVWCPFLAISVPRLDPETIFFNCFCENLGQTYKSRRYLVEKTTEFSQSRVENFRASIFCCSLDALSETSFNFGMDSPL